MLAISNRLMQYYISILVLSFTLVNDLLKIKAFKTNFCSRGTLLKAISKKKTRKSHIHSLYIGKADAFFIPGTMYLSIVK